MALDFTGIKDERGAAIYFIHDGTTRGEESMNRVMQDVRGRTKKQCVMIGGSKERTAVEIIKFYQLRGSQFVIIVRDDDQLHHVWSDGERFDAAQIAYTADRAG